MRAAILSIGDELALGQSLDTNSAFLAEALAARSIIVDEHRTVTDDRAAIAQAVRELAQGGGAGGAGAGRDLLITTGGLGPTEDDLTREALGDVFSPGEELVQDEQALRWLDHWFADRGRHMPVSNLRQALRPRSMRCLPNANGTAPGLAGTFRKCAIYALPGPPPEMIPMFREHVLPDLESLHSEHKTSNRPQGAQLLTGKVNLFGIGESLAAERIADLMPRNRNPLVGITVSGAIISARIRAMGPGEPAGRMRERVEHDLAEIESRWRPYAYGRGDETLSQALGRLLKENQRTLSTAESCTGGWLGKLIVDVAGSSAYYLGGWITYANEMKTSCLGVEGDLIAAQGAVSAEVACSMAQGARQRSGADHALAVTGVAGPKAAPNKSPGLVYIALASKCGATIVRRFEFTGDRSAVRERSVLAAMQMLRFELLGLGGENVALLWESRSEGAVGRA